MARRERVIRKYYTSTSLSGILDREGRGAKIMDVVGNCLEFYINEYKKIAQKTNIPSVVHSFHFKLDEVLGLKTSLVPGLADKISCKKGCAYCCYLHIDASRDEALLIKAFCEEQGMSMRKNRLQVQSQAKNAEDWRALSVEQKRCVFLDNANECLIYEHRPASCRKYLVLTDPKFCDSEVIRKVPLFVDLNVEILASAMLNIGENGTLSEMLLSVMAEED